MRTLFRKTLSKTSARHVLFVDRESWAGEAKRQNLSLETVKDQSLTFHIARSSTGSGKIRGGFFSAASFGWMSAPRVLLEGETHEKVN